MSLQNHNFFHNVIHCNNTSFRFIQLFDEFSFYDLDSLTFIINETLLMLFSIVNIILLIFFVVLYTIHPLSCRFFSTAMTDSMLWSIIFCTLRNTDNCNFLNLLKLLTFCWIKVAHMIGFSWIYKTWVGRMCNQWERWLLAITLIWHFQVSNYLL